MPAIGYVDPDFGQDYRIISPSTVLNRMRELDGQADLVNAAVGEYTTEVARQTGGEAFVRAWASFYGEWKLFFRENQDWLSRFTSGVVEQAEGYAVRFNALEARFRAFDIADPGTPTREEVEEAIGSNAILWAGLAVVSLFGIALLVREGTKAAREARAFMPPINSPSWPAMAGVRHLR